MACIGGGNSSCQLLTSNKASFGIVMPCISSIGHSHPASSKKARPWPRISSRRLRKKFCRSHKNAAVAKPVISKAKPCEKPVAASSKAASHQWRPVATVRCQAKSASTENNTP